MDVIRYRQLDQVQLRTTKRVKYLSAPPDHTLSPSGVWTVAGAVAGDLLLTQRSVTIRIPPEDVELVAVLNPARIISTMENLLHGQEKVEDKQTGSVRRPNHQFE